MSSPPSINGTHPHLQWYKRGTTGITLVEALDTAIPVDVLDNTVVDADAYYHFETDTLIVVEGDTVQTVIERDDAPLRCPHDLAPMDCSDCTPQYPTPDSGPFDGSGHPVTAITTSTSTH